jgi:hypothetical protein
VAVDRIAFSFKSRMDTYKMVLRGVKGYHDGSEQIDVREFQAYVTALNLQDTVPGLQGIAYVKRLKPPAGTETMCDNCSAQGNACSTAFGLKVIAFRVLPHHPHRASRSTSTSWFWGVDVGTVAQPKSRRWSVRGTPASWRLTAAVPLLQFAGVHRRPRAWCCTCRCTGVAPMPETLAQRRDRLEGWVAAPFRMQDLLQGMRQQLDKDIDLAIYDGPVVDAAVRLTPARGCAQKAHWRKSAGLSRAADSGLW